MAKFVDRKRPLDMIAAAAQNKECQSSHMILVGGGELMADCQNAVNSSELENVHLVGFINQSELPMYYEAADVFVLPSSYETWGLVINEAMASGLPCIVSDACGAAKDLIIEGKTGFSYPMGDVKQLAILMKLMANNKENRRQMGLNAAEYVQQFSVESVVSALKKALHCMGNQ